MLYPAGAKDCLDFQDRRYVAMRSVGTHDSRDRRVYANDLLVFEDDDETYFVHNDGSIEDESGHVIPAIYREASFTIVGVEIGRARIELS
jgi:hypothetical protein